MPADKRSPVWNYFYQDTSKTVRCTLCDTTLKYFGSTSNMSSHFKAKHGIALGEEANAENIKDSSMNDDDDDKMDSPSRSPSPDPFMEEVKAAPKTQKGPKKRSSVWKFFTQEGPKGVRCNICSKLLKYCGSTTNMNNHFKTRHANDTPDVPVNLKNVKAEVQDSEDDDDYGKSVPTPPSTEQRVRRSMTQKRKLNDNSSENESGEKRSISKQELKDLLIDLKKYLKHADSKMNRPETELEIFGRYIAAQLLKLPPEDALQCQKTIQSLMTEYRMKSLQNGASSANNVQSSEDHRQNAPEQNNSFHTNY